MRKNVFMAGIVACLLAGMSVSAKEDKTVGGLVIELKADSTRSDTLLRVGDAVYRLERNGLLRNVENTQVVKEPTTCTAEGCVSGDAVGQADGEGGFTGDWARMGSARENFGEFLPARELKKWAGEDLFLLVCCDAEGRVLEVSFQMSEKSGFTLEQVVALERYLKKRHRVDMSAKKGDKDVYRVMYMLSV